LRYTEEELPRSLDASLRRKRHEMPTNLGDTRDISETDEESDYDSEFSVTEELHKAVTLQIC